MVLQWGLSEFLLAGKFTQSHKAFILISKLLSCGVVVVLVGLSVVSDP